MLSLLLLSANLLSPADAQNTALFLHADLPTVWALKTGTCNNLWLDCLYAEAGIESGGHECEQCLEDCRKTADINDYPATGFSSDCGDIDRTDCERVKLKCESRCSQNVVQCGRAGAESDGSLCDNCYSDCATYWVPQCELKRNYDLNGEGDSYDATECLDVTRWPQPGSALCCSTLVYADYAQLEVLGECQSRVYHACENTCWDLAAEDWDAAEVCLAKCECYFDYPVNDRTREECEAVGQSNAVSVHGLSNPDSTALYLIGGFIALMLTCIAGLLSWAVCVGPLLKMYAAQEKYCKVNQPVGDEPL